MSRSMDSLLTCFKIINCGVNTSAVRNSRLVITQMSRVRYSATVNQIRFKLSTGSIHLIAEFFQTIPIKEGTHT